MIPSSLYHSKGLMERLAFSLDVWYGSIDARKRYLNF